MCRRLICVLSFVLVLSMCSNIAYGQAGLIGFWRFDEVSGTTASDYSGSGNNGTLVNGVEWRPGEGMYDGALFVNPADASGYCEISTAGMKASEGTLMVWGKLADPQPIRNSYFMGHTTQPAFSNRIQLHTDSADNMLDLGLGDTHARRNRIVDLALETWYHIALTWDTGAYVVYVNGEDKARGTYTGLTTLYPIMDIGNDGHDQGTRAEAFGGLLDEMKIFDRALTAQEIQQAMEPIPRGVASAPSPADAATDVPLDVVLSWTPGEFAPPVNGHKIYLSKSFNDVNDGVGGIIQSATSYAPPQRLDFGTTYYWRVDEVNGPPDYTVFEGEVWQFTTEPVSYPIENVTATASSEQSADTRPENTINGSGLDDNDLHSKDESDMWLSSVAGPHPTWIQYEFDKVYKLHQIIVWNSNQAAEPVVGFGFKDVTIEYSVNGTDYTTLGTTHLFAQAPGTTSYAYNTTIDFGGVGAKYVRLTANSNWGGILAQYGLSEVRFFYIPVNAREPSPDSGATDVDVDVVLSWRAGREAAQHDVYVSSDQQAVIDGTAPAATVTETSHGPLSLDLAQTYYWKVNEVNEAEALTTWESNVWNFTTTEFLVVENFESYNDLDPGEPDSNRIFLTWIDGYEQPTNGSRVGYETPPFCEQTIVHGGKQSMPLAYNNADGATYSEVELTLSPPQDWSKHGVKALSLWFSGDPDNTAAQMYVKINGSKVMYDGDATNLTVKSWQPWNIDLAASGVNVTKVAIGIDGNGAAGILYFDDIRLYPYDRQLMTPAEPDLANLVGHWKLDGNFDDSSGNNHHGAAMGNPTFVAGKIGQAISLDGMGDYVNITGYKGVLGPNAVTVTTWVQTSITATGAIVGWGRNVAGQRFGFRINAGRLRLEHQGGNVQGDSNVNDDAWHHVAVTIQENATVSYPEVVLYVDGVDDTRTTTDPDAFNLTAGPDVSIGRRPSADDRYFIGQIDDVRIYDRALTPEEIAWLAGRTKPFDKPF